MKSIAAFKVPDEFVKRKQAEARERGPVERTSLCSPDCHICEGRGYYRKFHGDTEWYEYACPRSYDLKPKAPHTLTWDTIPKDGNIGQAIAAIKNLLAIGSGWLYLWGKPGRGKTTMLKAAQNDPKGTATYYTDTLAIIDDLRGAFDEAQGQKTLQFRQKNWIRHKALLLDEFDRVGTTDFVKERLYRVMDGRYQGALDEKSLTIMVSNSPPNVLDRYLQDRIEEFQVFEVRTPSSLRL